MIKTVDRVEKIFELIGYLKKNNFRVAISSITEVTYLFCEYNNNPRTLRYIEVDQYGVFSVYAFVKPNTIGSYIQLFKTSNISIDDLKKPFFIGKITVYELFNSFNEFMDISLNTLQEVKLCNCGVNEESHLPQETCE